AEHPIEDIQAYEYYLKANTECFKMTEESINQALRYLNSALEITGDNAYIYSGLAWSYWWLVNIGVKHDEGIKLAEDNIKKALELNPDLSIPHALSGWINMSFKGKIKLAARDFKIAITKNPDDHDALIGINYLYVVLTGHKHLATSSLEKLIKIDPLDSFVGIYKGYPHFYSGAFNKALTEWSKLYKLYPDVPLSWFYYTLGLAYNNRVDEVISLIDIKVKTFPDHILSKILLMLKYALINDTEKLNQILTPELITTCKRDGMYSHHLAGIFAIANEKDQALDWLENAINAGFINYPMLSEKDIFLENIRTEKRFKLLMKRVKKEWENFEE
ncbi:MAG: hypothetical protein KAS97_11815, partial [Candidatus Aminicenantes bacterium]|nr:hypothetical protein [Candidatus Aminicenantes bacterium]